MPINSSAVPCVLVTGASGGIGSAIAAGFAAAGHPVVLGCRTGLARVQAQAAAITAAGGRALPFAADVTSEAAVDALFAAAQDAFGPVEVLVNCAGTSLQKMLCDTTRAQWDALFAANVTGSFLCAKRALESMVRSHRGSIVNLSSIWGQTGASCEVAYSAAKAAIIGFTQALAKEVAPAGVRVNCVAPGIIDAGMMDAFSAEEKRALAAEVPLGRLGTAEEAAAAVLFLASDAASYITGQVLSTNGGFGVY